MSESEIAVGETEEDVEVLTPGTVIVVVDPLCGWCWGAAPAIARLQAAGVRLEIVASGLFIGDRPVTAEFAEYAWTNDCRIHGLTGQTFSEVYREKVLGNHGSVFDSGPATLALTAVQLAHPERVVAVLHALQAARFVDGRDVTSEAVCAEVLRETGIDEETIGAFLGEADEVIDALNHRATFARELMTRLGARGVPAVVRVSERGAEQVDGRHLFENVDQVVFNVAATQGAA